MGAGATVTSGGGAQAQVDAARKRRADKDILEELFKIRALLAQANNLPVEGS